MLLVVNHCKNHNVVINFDFSRGCQNNFRNKEKHASFALLSKQFLSVPNCASVYSLALYRQVFLVISLVCVWGALERFLFTRSGFKFLTQLESKTSQESHNASLLVCAVVCAYPFNVHRSEKQSKLCLPGSHYLSSFRELTKSIWTLFLFQNFKELATVASENYPISAQVQSACTEVTAHENLLCF